MFQFTYWLEHFKEMSPPKAQSVVKVINQLSDKAATVCGSVTLLAQCKSPAAFNKTRQAIMRQFGNDLTQAEKKALSLFGDYIEFREYSSFKFPEEPTPLLAEYCKTMQMSYSYKAVLIHELVGCGVTGVSTDTLVERIIAFYQDRMDHGKAAERDDSIFAKANINFAAARKTIISNPVKVLLDSKVIVWNKRTGIISFASDYLPGSDAACNEVRAICKERLQRYYSSIKPKKTKKEKEDGQCNKRVKTLMARLDAEIQKTADKSAKKKLGTIYASLCTELGINSKKKRNVKQKGEKKKPTSSTAPLDKFVALSQSDERKVGALVQESLAVLEKIGYHFSDSQLQSFQSLEWSNTNLKLNYAFFKLLDESKPVSEQRIDHLGNGRYYSRIFTFNGRKYLVTSQWYSKSKALFISWYNELEQL